MLTTFLFNLYWECPFAWCVCVIASICRILHTEQQKKSNQTRIYLRFVVSFVVCPRHKRTPTSLTYFKYFCFCSRIGQQEVTNSQRQDMSKKMYSTAFAIVHFIPLCSSVCWMWRILAYSTISLHGWVIFLSIYLCVDTRCPLVILSLLPSYRSLCRFFSSSLLLRCSAQYWMCYQQSLTGAIGYYIVLTATEIAEAKRRSQIPRHRGMCVEWIYIKNQQTQRESGSHCFSSGSCCCVYVSYMSCRLI